MILKHNIEFGKQSKKFIQGPQRDLSIKQPLLSFTA